MLFTYRFLHHTFSHTNSDSLILAQKIRKIAQISMNLSER
jgi:hypothetical protein